MESAAAILKFTKFTTLNTTWSHIQSEKLDLCPSNSFLNTSKYRKTDLIRKKITRLFLVHCSIKPDTDRSENATDEDLSSEPSSNSRIQEQAASTTSSGVSSGSSVSRGLVFGLGFQGSWDTAEIGSPVVKRYLSDEEERWYMWYHGRSKGKPSMDSIGLAVSSNGIHWERGEGAVKSSGDVGLTMNSSSDWWAFDTQGIRPREVVIMSSTKVRANNSLYWLYYTGFNAEMIESLDNSLKFNLNNPERPNFDAEAEDCEGNVVGRILKSLPGLAMSQDGRHWARIEGEHHSGALFDVGSEGEWDSLFIASPQVVYHGAGDMRMYYHSFDVEKGQFCAGIARSRDGIKWMKLGKIMLGGGSKCMFDEMGVTNAYVVKDRKDGSYVMAYEAVASDGKRSIGIAFSSDGLKQWRRFQEVPVLKQSEEDGWDCGGVGSPCLVQMDGDEGEWRLYYRGVDKVGKTGIGLAVSQGSEFAKLKRWTGFHL